MMLSKPLAKWAIMSPRIKIIPIATYVLKLSHANAYFYYASYFLHQKYACELGFSDILGHTGYITFQMAEVVISKEIFAKILSRIERLRCYSV